MRLTLLGLVGLSFLPARAEVSFNRDIRPIMSDTCFRCHGPDRSSRMANMRLDIREEALKPNRKGVAPIVPGDPEHSNIIHRIFAPSAAQIMPPAAIHKELTEAQKKTIRQWVAEGAKYEGHWAYSPVRRPETHSTGNPIDEFIQARLAKEGLTPSPAADKTTLIRRVTLDLTGLPPSPEEVSQFAADNSPGAWTKVVDRLLASPRFAEKQSLLWLDAVRYADTCGFHGDNPWPAWPYRDYVLRSFRDNKPFDQFTREQLAGDFLPGVDSWTGSAYNRMTRTSAEGGLQPKEYLAKYAADRVRTTSSVWLGSTMGCAECHDHKFDPFTQKDFYSMKAFFADIKETGLVPDRGKDAWGSLLALPTEEQRIQMADLEAQIEARRRKLATHEVTPPAGLLDEMKAGKLAWQFPTPLTATSANGSKLTIYNEELLDSMYDFRGSLVSDKKPGRGTIVASGPNPDNETYTVTFKPGAGSWNALGLEVIQDESLPGMRVARGSDRFVLTEFDASVNGRALPIVLATANVLYPVPEHPVMAVLDGDPATGWGVTMYGEGRNVFLALRLGATLETTASDVITIRLHHDSKYRRAVLGRFRVAVSAAKYGWPGTTAIGSRDRKTAEEGVPEGALAALEAKPELRTEAQSKSLHDYLVWASPRFQGEVIELAKLEAQRDTLDAQIPRVVYSDRTEPAVTRILARGNFMDDSGQVVKPAIPGFLGKLPAEDPTRLDLANWLVSPENPLTARVFVNRMWREFFGQGLSKVLDDLGSQGEWPVHQEVLDWLAAEFMRPQWQADGTHAWDVKHLIRTIVLSNTYRQSSLPRTDLETKDPDNKLLARQNRYRVDAEVVRDIELSASGLLVESFGGPSVKPVQPEGYLAALNFPKRDYSASRGDGLYRRTLYTFWQRSFLHPALLAFDAPTREECTVNRVNSNTPLQALVLLNDPEFVEAARVFAQHALAQGGTTLPQRINWTFQQAVQRNASAAEAQALTALYRRSLTRFRAAPERAREFIHAGESPLPSKANPVELAAMMTVTRAVLNMHETVTRN